VITCCIRYTLHPHRIADFERYAATWPPIIARCGGALLGYFLPKEGPNNFALALIEFGSLAAYEIYREALRADRGAQENFAHAMRTECVQAEDRCFLRRV
jgi:NIPSNAP protein